MGQNPHNNHMIWEGSFISILKANKLRKAKWLVYSYIIELELEPRTPDSKIECAFQGATVPIISELRKTKSGSPARITWVACRRAMTAQQTSKKLNKTRIPLLASLLDLGSQRFVGLSISLTSWVVSMSGSFNEVQTANLIWQFIEHY